MIASKQRARLMEVVKINEGYPYYGGLIFKDDTVYPNSQNLSKKQTQSPKPKANEVWVYQEVLDLLSLKINEQIKIGKENFTIKKIIIDDTLKTISFSGFMPKIYISEEV